MKPVRALAVAAALAAAGSALWTPEFRRTVDGTLSHTAWTLAVAALALAVCAIVWRTRWQQAGALFALAVASQSAEYGLINSISASVLEHYRAVSTLLSWPDGFLLAVPFIQLGLSLLAARSAASSASLPRINLTRGRLAIAVLVCIAISANGRFEAGRFVGDIALAGLVVVANLVNLAVLAAAVPADVLRRAGTWIDGPAGRRIPAFCTVWVVAASAAIAFLVFDRTPIIPDAVAYLAQAKYFAAGYLVLPAPAELPAFEFDKLYSDGATWWAYGFPGWPALLAIGVRLGAPWLVNPILAGITVLLVHALLSRLYGASFGRRATLLLSASPWFLFMSGSYMPHASSLLWVCVSLFAVWKAWNTGRPAWAALGGAALGASFLTRPLEALLLAPAIGLFMLGVTGHRVRWTGILAFVLGGAATTSLLLAYNHGVTGNALRTPHSAYADARDFPGADRLGFGPEVGDIGWRHLDPLPGHGPLDVVINAHQNAYMVNADLLGWRFGSVLLVVIFLLRGVRQPADRLFLLMLATIVVGHSVYWFSGGPDIGARYWYQILIPLVVLTLRGAQGLVSGAEAESDGLAEGEFDRPAETGPGGRAGAGSMGLAGGLIAAASLAALVTFVPWRALVKYHDFRGMDADLERMAETLQFGHSVVFVREHDPSDYSRAFLLNTPGFTGCGTVYARDLGPESRARVLQHFPGRTWWILEGPVPTSSPFTVIEGPVGESTPCEEDGAP